MTRTTARTRTEADCKTVKALSARQRVQMKAGACGKKVGSSGLVGKAGKTIAGRVKTTDKKTKAGVKGGRIANKVKPAPKNIKNDISLGRAVKQQEINKNVSAKKSKAATPAVKKCKTTKIAVKKVKAATPVAKRGKAATPVAKRGKAAAPVAKRGKAATPAVKKCKTTKIAVKKVKAATPIAKRGKAATPVAKRGKAAAPVAKRGKAATPVVKKGKAATTVAKKGKVTPAATIGSKVVTGGKGKKRCLPVTKQNRGTTVTLARQAPAAMKGRQLARTVASRGKGAKGLSAGSSVTPVTTVGRKRAAGEPAYLSLNQPPAKLARVDSINTQIRKALAVATTPSASTSKAAKKAAAAKTYKIDDELSGSVTFDAKVYKDYSCMLNQTNIGFNNNKFYVIQVVENGLLSFKNYIFFTRWGRVGESGQNKMERFTDADKAVKAFEKKFFDKTHNGWKSRHKFTPKPNKYTLLEMDEEDDDEPKPRVSKITTSASVSSSLDERTQRLAKLIFSNTMFTQQMADMNLDVNKMPLGKLSRSQIAKGLEALLDIEEAIKKGNRAVLNPLTSKFYTLIPHNFGRSVPPVIQTLDVLQQKKDMLITLADIELTQSLQKKGAAAPTQNPLDAKMNALGCKLTLVDRISPEFKWIREYSTACPNSRKSTLLDVWRVDRDGEHTRFSRNDSIKYRKLLWHGTSVAVVAAILNSGLRIMPHSGGRVGRGIYFASEHAKSSFYVGIHGGAFEGETDIGFMFLVEVALGRMDNITISSGQQKAAPPGHDSIVARGWTEPDSDDDLEIVYDGKKVIVPKGKPKRIATYSGSYFSQSEYLVYREDQARIRYLLKFSFT